MTCCANRGRRGVALAETSILLLWVAVVGTSFAVMFWGADGDDQVYAARHNLSKLRRLVRQYRVDHNGRCPSDLSELTQSSSIWGDSSGTSESSASHPIAAYLLALPENPVSRAPYARRSLVRRISHHPAELSDVTPNNRGGWLYNPDTGGVWIDHDQFLAM